MAAMTLTSLDHGTERLVLRLTEHRGQKQFDLRIFDAAGFPTRAGFTLDPAKLPILREAINAAITVAQVEGLLPQAPTRRRRGA